MRRWQYETVAYIRKHKPGEPCIVGASVAMADIEKSARLHLDWFLKQAGEHGWELASTLVPFAPGKELSVEDENDERVSSSYVLEDALDVQWLIFKRQLS